MLKNLLASALLVWGVGAAAQLNVTTTIYPLYSIVKEIGGNKVQLNNMIPFGVEAHGFDPTPSDIAKLSKSDIFIVSSDAMEPWKDKIIESLKIENKVFDMSARDIYYRHCFCSGFITIKNTVTVILCGIFKSASVYCKSSGKALYSVNRTSFTNRILKSSAVYCNFA